MIEITVKVTERQLAEMDRMLYRKGVRGSEWLKDAVAIYKAILAGRKDRFDGPPRRAVLCSEPRAVAG